MRKLEEKLITLQDSIDIHKYMPPQLPDIPCRTWSITEHGAVERGKTLNTQANADRRPVDQRVYGTREAGVRSPMLRFINAERVLLEGVTFRESPS